MLLLSIIHFTVAIFNQTCGYVDDKYRNLRIKLHKETEQNDDN